MDRETFLLEALRACPDLASPGLAEALREFLSRDAGKAEFTQRDLAEVIQLAGQMRSATTATWSGKAQARDVVTRDRICNELQPEVEEIRKSLLGSTQSLDEAAAEQWIEKAISQELKRIDEKRPEGPVKEHAQSQTGARVVFEFAGTKYPVKSLDGGYQEIAVPLCYGTPFYRAVYGPLRSLLIRSGYPESQLLHWVLTGRRPDPERITVSLTEYPLARSEDQFGVEAWASLYEWAARFVSAVRNGQLAEAEKVLKQNRGKIPDHLKGGAFNSYHRQPPLYASIITLRIRAADLTFEELYQAYNALRRLPNQKRQKTNPMHFRIYELVRDSGGVPPVRKTEFWEGIQSMLAEEGKWKVPKTWQAVRRAYCRLLESF